MAETLQDPPKPDEPELQAPDPLRPGILAGAIIGELEQALEQVQETPLATPADRANAAATLASLATAADAMDRIMRRADADHAAALPPDLLRRAAVQIGRVAQMLSQAIAARGRFTTDQDPDELTTGPWVEVRILPDGYEDVDPAAIAHIAQTLQQAAR